ncbi:NAD(P)H-binding protein [Proteus mirabilis]|uniref:NAD(P)H-binding protein n=1 Tax=Proteus mirabilis TaxID=584 RepID=UPI0021D7B996|nr:NAD(P)H-binding protein [Proteus mirabilis]MCU9585672.1 NAD(P)H-binding protein [Proteus mirabilis]
MKILVAGATGKTGRRLIGELKSRGHYPIALVRESSDTSTLSSDVELRYGDLTDKVDRDGAQRLVDIAVKSKVLRFVMLSSVGADKPDPEHKLAHYLQAKHYADEHLIASGLSYAIVRPVRLTDESGTRNMRFGDSVDVGGIAARGDVAAVLAEAVDDEKWDNKALTMQSI